MKKKILFTAFMALAFIFSFAQVDLDSVAIQQGVQTADQIGQKFIPAPWNVFSPLITFFVTTLTGAIIRAIEKGKMKRKHKRELEEAKKQAK